MAAIDVYLNITHLPNPFGMLWLEPIRGGGRFWAGQAGDGGEE